MRTIYQCEICEGAYRQRRFAEECESFVLDPPKYVAGDEIIVKEDGHEGEFKIVEVLITRGYIRNYLDDIDQDTESARVENIQKVSVPHQWLYKLDRHAHINDDFYTDTITIENIETEDTCN